jgi:hypothetical protein
MTNPRPFNVALAEVRRSGAAVIAVADEAKRGLRGPLRAEVMAAAEQMARSVDAALLLSDGPMRTLRRTIVDVATVADSATVTVLEAPGLAQQVEYLKGQVGRLTLEVNTLLATSTKDGGASVAAPVARYLREHLADLLALLFTIASVLIAFQGVKIAQEGVEQDRAEYARSDPPPSVTVVLPQPDQSEIERIVDERLREREQQRAKHADDDLDDLEGHDRRGANG